MWWLLAFASAAFLGGYDSFKKISLKDNAVIPVLFLNTVLCALIFSPGLFLTGFGCWTVQRYIVAKSALVLSSWMAGYLAMKHLPLTIVGPVNATRPVLVLVGAIALFGEQLNGLQWTGVALAVMAYFLMRHSTTPFRWRWSIPFISLFLCAADYLYMLALSQPDALIAVVSMIRRGSVLVSFGIGAWILKEKNLKSKAIDLALLLVSMLFLYLGSR